MNLALTLLFLFLRCSQVTGLPAGFSVHPPELVQSSLEFSHSLAQTQHSHQSSQGRVSPCGAGDTHTNTHTLPYMSTLSDAHLYNPLEKIWKILRIRTVTRSRCCSLFTILCVCVFIIWSFSKWITCNSFLTKFVFKVLMYTSVCNLNGGKSKLFTGNLYKCMPS